MTLFSDISSMPEHCTVEHMADVVAKCLANWWIKNQVMLIVCNNASNNNKMVNPLAMHEWKMFHGYVGFMRCFAHMLYLVVGVSQLCC
jgi:hypothetical protein